MRFVAFGYQRVVKSPCNLAQQCSGAGYEVGDGLAQRLDGIERVVAHVDQFLHAAVRLVAVFDVGDAQPTGRS